MFKDPVCTAVGDARDLQRPPPT